MNHILSNTTLEETSRKFSTLIVFFLVLLFFFFLKHTDYFLLGLSHLLGSAMSSEFPHKATLPSEASPERC